MINKYHVIHIYAKEYQLLKQNIEPFAPTDKTWPQFMRVNPILDWSYSEIWFFIRLLQLPYCSLYDQGYTSIDDKSNTVPNKELLLQTPSNQGDKTNQDEKNSSYYLPAYRLRNQDAERLSREKKK